MADLSNSSFIPKRGPTKKKRATASRRVYLFTLFSYISIFSVLLASAGFFAYTKILESDLNKSIQSLAQASNIFSVADMNRVREFDLRLQQASDRVSNSVSIPSVFQALEEATIRTVQIQTLNLDREADERLLMSAEILTDSFDSTIFQRSVYGTENGKIASVEIKNVNETSAASGEGEEIVNTDPDDVIKSVTFTAELGIPVASVPFEGATNVQDDFRNITESSDSEAGALEDLPAESAGNINDI